MNELTNYLSMLLALVLALTLVTNIIVQVLKSLLYDMLPTNLLAFLVAAVVTVGAATAKAIKFKPRKYKKYFFILITSSFLWYCKPPEPEILP